jgi:cell division protein FtsQ
VSHLAPPPLPGDRVATDPRLSRRRRTVARLRRRRIAGRVALAMAMAAGLWVVVYSPLLSLRAIAVVGGRHTTSGDVAAAARLGSADNILLLSTAKVAARAESLPWVRTAKVERKLPGTLKVTVIERRPAVVLEGGGRHWRLDRRGLVLARGGGARGLPVLAAGDALAVRVGERVPGSAARAALAALRALGPGARRRVEAVLAPSPQRISLRFSDGTLVRWGSRAEGASKRAVLRALLARLRARAQMPAYIDVSVPVSPATSALAPGARRDALRARPGPSPAR